MRTPHPQALSNALAFESDEELGEFIDWVMLDLAARDTSGKNSDEPLIGMWVIGQRPSSKGRGKAGVHRGKAYFHKTDRSLRRYVVIRALLQHGHSMDSACAQYRERERLFVPKDKIVGAAKGFFKELDVIRVGFSKFKPPFPDQVLPEWINSFRFWRDWATQSPQGWIDFERDRFQKQLGEDAALRYEELIRRVRRRAQQKAAHREPILQHPGASGGTALIGLLVISFLLSVPWTAAAQPHVPGTWVMTGSMNVARYRQTATLLPNGKVLVVGGFDSTGAALSTAEVYDPATGTWGYTGTPNILRQRFTATLLSSGKVLVAGGDNNSGNVLAAELYSPETGTWTVTGSMNVGRFDHTATRLSSGKVLIAGGYNGFNQVTAELYDPETGTWTKTGDLHIGRTVHTATLLPTGKVLVVGGFNNTVDYLRQAELYDPEVGTWSQTGSMGTRRFRHTATLLLHGRVLVAGGGNDAVHHLETAELYDVTSGTWAATGSMSAGREIHTATLLPNGKVLVAGGLAGPTNGDSLASAELYNPRAGTWSVTGGLNNSRLFHTATVVPVLPLDGRVLVAGGVTTIICCVTAYLASTELYLPKTGRFAGP